MTTTTTSPIIDRALAAIDDPRLLALLDEVRDRKRTLAERHPVPPSHGRPRERTLEQVRSIVEGAPIPDDLGQLVAGSEPAVRVRDAEGAVLERLPQAIAQAIAERRHDRADDGLAVVRDEVDQIVASAREVFFRLDRDVVDEETARDRDQLHAWRDASELARRHREAREAQATLSILRPPRPDDYEVAAATQALRLLISTDRVARLHVDVFGHVADPGQWVDLGVWLGRREVILRGAPGTSPDVLDPGLVPDLTGKPQLVPELRGRTRQAPWLSDDRVAVLRFLARDDVEAIAPTRDEISAAAGAVARWAPAPTPDEEAQAETARRLGELAAAAPVIRVSGGRP